MKSKIVSSLTQPKFRLSEKVLGTISKSTKLTKDELINQSFEQQFKLMESRGVKNNPHTLKDFLIRNYKKLGEKLGLLKREYNIYTHTD